VKRGGVQKGGVKRGGVKRGGVKTGEVKSGGVKRYNGERTCPPHPHTPPHRRHTARRAWKAREGGRTSRSSALRRGGKGMEGEGGRAHLEGVGAAGVGALTNRGVKADGEDHQPLEPVKMLDEVQHDGLPPHPAARAASLAASLAALRARHHRRSRGGRAHKAEAAAADRAREARLRKRGQV
jgi:hypothetical protein